MCNSKCCSKKGGAFFLISKVLLVIGGLNWGLVGLGMLFGKMDSWNVVHMLLGSVSMLEGIVYLLIGIATIGLMFSCKCKKSMTNDAPVSGIAEKQTETRM